MCHVVAVDMSSETDHATRESKAEDKGETTDSKTEDKGTSGEARPSTGPGVLQRIKKWWSAKKKTKTLLMDLKALEMSIDQV